MTPSELKVAMNFGISSQNKQWVQLDVPQGRNGKHKEIVTQIRSVSSINCLQECASKSLSKMAEAKRKSYHRLSRAIRQEAGEMSANPSDGGFWYVWNKAEVVRYDRRLAAFMRLLPSEPSLQPHCSVLRP